jgi:RNA polymerase sigma factor for flagellar operon FliA
MPPSEADLWKRYQSTRTVEDRNALVEWYLHLVRRIGARLIKSLPDCIELDDLFSYGTFGLMDAIRLFDPENGAAFPTFAGTRIRGAMIDGLRQMDWLPRHYRRKWGNIEAPASLDAETTLDHGSVVSVGAIIPDPDAIDPLTAAEIQDSIEHATQRLNNQEARLVGLYFLKGLTMREAGDVTGVSESRVSQVLANAQQTLWAVGRREELLCA